MSKPGYFAVIPANVRYDSRLLPGAKLIYAEVTALCNKEGFCWAENKYFAELYNVAERTIQRYIEDLVNCGHFVVEISDNRQRRKIYLASERVTKMSPVRVTGMSYPGDRNVIHNTKTNNTLFLKEKEVIQSSVKSKKKRSKIPIPFPYDEAKKKWPTIVTDRAIKVHSKKFEEYYTEGEGQLAPKINWPLTFKNWVERGFNRDGTINEVSTRVVIETPGCKFCDTSGAIGKPCPYHSKKES